MRAKYFIKNFTDGDSDFTESFEEAMEYAEEMAKDCGMYMIEGSDELVIYKAIKTIKIDVVDSIKNYKSREEFHSKYINADYDCEEIWTHRWEDVE